MSTQRREKLVSISDKIVKEINTADFQQDLGGLLKKIKDKEVGF